MNIATISILFAKQSGINPFIAEKRGDVIWVSDAKGTLEIETNISDIGWQPIEFEFGARNYEADMNIYEANGEIKISIHTYKTDGEGNIVTSGEKFITVPVKQ